VKENTKPKDQHWSLYKKQSKNLYYKLRSANATLKVVKDLHADKHGVCQECNDAFPCTTVKLIRIEMP
jgi:hypothetical protein